MPRRRMDPRGRALLVGSVLVFAFLLGSLFAVMFVGIEHWRRNLNPNPLGYYSLQFFVSTLFLLLCVTTAALILPAYVGEYRSETLELTREAAARRWVGTLFLFSGVPFFLFGWVFSAYAGTALWLAGLVAVFAGTGFHASAAWGTAA